MVMQAKLADGRTLEFPDGTDPAVIQATVKRLIGGQNDGMAIAAPVGAAPDVALQPSPDTQGSDILPGPGNPVEGGALDPLKNAALEVIAGVNRGALSVADIPADIANAIAQLSGTDFRVPTLRGTEIGQQATSGGFVEDPTARQVLGTVGEFLAPAPPVGALAGRSADIGGDLIAASGAARPAGLADQTIQAVTQQSPAKQKIAQKLIEDPANISLVKFIKDGSGRIAKDKLALSAIKQGFDEGVVATIKGAKPRDRRRMQEMVQILKKGKQNARFAAANRPTDVAGKSLLERVNHIKSVNTQAGSAIDKAARNLRGKSADFTAPINEFSQKLDDFGVRLVEDSKGNIKANFDDSVLSPGDRGPIREIIRQMARIGREGAPDALSAHKMKRIIDNNVTFGKNKTGLGGDAARALKDFRRGLDGVLDANFPAYNKANTDYSDTINALDLIQDAAGTKLDLFGKSADKAIGTALRRLLSNTQSRVRMIDAIDEIEKVSRKTGKTFDDDVLSQVLFADELDSMFGAAARTSFKGQIQQAVETGAQAARRGVLDTALDAGGAGVERLRGINEENAIKSIEELLRR